MAGELVRAAAKLTGVSMIPGGIRGKAAEHLSVSSFSRMPFSARPSAASVTSGEEAAGEPMPRVVFHGAPTLEEAKEATSELIFGIEKIYPLSRDYDGSENSVTVKHESDSSLSNSQVEQANASTNGEITMEPAVPPTVYTAFRLLHESSAARNVVTSIACDPNVVRAVLQNQQLQEFLHLERRCWASSHSVTGPERLDELYAENTENIEDSSNNEESKWRLSFEDLLKIMKDMVDMIQNLSGLFKNLLVREGAAKSFNGDHGAAGASAENVIEASLLGLAIMVIMLIFLKRG